MCHPLVQQVSDKEPGQPSFTRLLLSLTSWFFRFCGLKSFPLCHRLTQG